MMHLFVHNINRIINRGDKILVSEDIVQLYVKN